MPIISVSTGLYSPPAYVSCYLLVKQVLVSPLPQNCQPISLSNIMESTLVHSSSAG
jgi:hypothetical protein